MIAFTFLYDIILLGSDDMFDAELGILKMLESVRTDFLTNVFEYITMIGEETILIVIMAIVYFAFDKELARRIFFITATSLLSNNIIKNAFKIPRPFIKGITCARESTATGYSFPSGHTQTISTWSGAFAFYYKRRSLIITSVILTLLVGFSRLYLGAHYPSDVCVGMLLGFFFAYFGNKFCDTIKNTDKSYLTVTALFTILAAFYLVNPDPLYEDFFKIYGMFGGFTLSTMFENRYVNLNNNTSAFKKAIRVVLCIVVSLFIKDSSKAIFVASSSRMSLILDAVRYFVLVFIILGVCPLVFKKIKI